MNETMDARRYAICVDSQKPGDEYTVIRSSRPTAEEALNDKEAALKEFPDAESVAIVERMGHGRFRVKQVLQGAWKAGYEFNA